MESRVLEPFEKKEGCEVAGGTAWAANESKANLDVGDGTDGGGGRGGDCGFAKNCGGMERTFLCDRGCGRGGHAHKGGYYTVLCSNRLHGTGQLELGRGYQGRVTAHTATRRGTVLVLCCSAEST